MALKSIRSFGSIKYIESYHSSYIIINLNVGNWEMECLRGDIIIDLCQEFQEYKIPALAQKQRNLLLIVALAPTPVQKSNTYG